MSQESVPHLVNFVYEAFGVQCAALLMIGLGEESAQAEKKFYVQETVDGGVRHWEIGVVANALPYRSEPLVLAALLKMLLRHKTVPFTLEFQVSEVMEELLRAGVAITYEHVDRIIAKYIALSYDKREKSDEESDGAGGGMYSLLVGYLRGSVKEAGASDLARVSNSVQFDQSFVVGLRRGDVVLAGIPFGKLGGIAAY
jgi:hypothetical protein